MYLIYYNRAYSERINWNIKLNFYIINVLIHSLCRKWTIFFYKSKVNNLCVLNTNLLSKTFFQLTVSWWRQDVIVARFPSWVVFFKSIETGMMHRSLTCLLLRDKKTQLFQIFELWKRWKMRIKVFYSEYSNTLLIRLFWSSDFPITWSSLPLSWQQTPTSRAHYIVTTSEVSFYA